MFHIFFCSKIVNASICFLVTVAAGLELSGETSKQQRGKERCLRRRYDSGFSDKKMEVGIRLNFVCLVARTEKRTSMKGVATE